MISETFHFGMVEKILIEELYKKIVEKTLLLQDVL